MTHNQAITQNLHSCVKLNKRKVLVLFLCLSLCASFFAFPVSASSDGAPTIFDSQPFDGSLDFTLLSQNGNGGIGRFVLTSSSAPVYCFAYSVYNSGTYYGKVSFCSETNFSVSISRYSYANDSFIDSITRSDSHYDSSSQLYYSDSFTNSIERDTYTYYIPYFSTISDGLAAVRDYIDNPPDSGPALEPFSYSLAPGNVIFIDVSGSDPTDVAVLTSSTGFSYSASELQNTNQAFGYLDSIPSSFTLPLSGTNNIPWAPAGNANLYGKYQHKTRSVYAYSSNHQYFVVVNPTYDPYTLASGVVGDNVAFAYDNSNATNSYIDISGFSARAFKVYSLNSQLIYDSGGWSSVTETDGPSYSGSYDSTTQTWTTVNDTSGEPESPPLGGTNNIESDATTSETIFAWLETIASSIGSFFRGSIGAVTSLVASGSEFFRSISGLYSWLPSPVLSVLLNALIIAITIGVIKVFI